MKRIMVAGLAAVLLGTGFMSSLAQAQWRGPVRPWNPAAQHRQNAWHQGRMAQLHRHQAQRDFNRASHLQAQDRIRNQMI